MLTAGIHNPYWDSLGGGERYTATFIRFLLEQDYQVEIFWPKDISHQIKARFDVDISQAKFTQPHFLLPHRYSLIFWVSDGSLPTSFARKTIIHFQIPFHGIGGHNLPNFLRSRFYVFVANSQFTKRAVDHEFSINSQVIYPPIDTHKFTPSAKTNTIFYIGRFSRLTQLKGQEILIESFRRIHSRLPGWKLILAGGTSVGTTPGELGRLRRLAADLPVEFILNPAFSQIKKICAEGKIFWSASGYSAPISSPIRTEHFGITVVEAMAAGAVPLIANRGGHPEIVSSGRDGYLWDSPRQLEKYTLELAHSPSLTANLSQAARLRSSMFDTSVFNSQFAKLLL